MGVIYQAATTTELQNLVDCDLLASNWRKKARRQLRDEPDPDRRRRLGALT